MPRNDPWEKLENYIFEIKLLSERPRLLITKNELRETLLKINRLSKKANNIIERFLY